VGVQPSKNNRWPLGASGKFWEEYPWRVTTISQL
jgi:hypothetical protein